MHAHETTWAALAAAVLIGVAAIACGGTGAVAAGNAQLAVNLVDAPNPNVSEIWVQVERVVAHTVPGGWVTLSTTPAHVDLLKLQSQAQALGILELEAGTVTQLRLVVAPDDTGKINYVVANGAPVPLKVPSGTQSGIKIKGPWDLNACQKSAITLDFDGKSSIHLASTGDAYNLRPVIRVKKVETSDVGCRPDTGAADAGTPPATTPPAPLPFGKPCTAASECLSGACSPADKTCAAGPTGAACVTVADCQSGTCSTENTCAAPTNALGTGAACTAPDQCLSASCTNGTCDASPQGLTCSQTTDCDPGFTCSASSCVPNSAL